MLTKSVAAQAPFAATTHTITFYFKSGSRNQGPETRDRERAPARCCLQSLSAFEHHGHELRQHAHTTCSQLGCLRQGKRSLQQRPCYCAHRPKPTDVTPGRASPVLCCAVRVSCLLHRPCHVPFLAPSAWQDGLPFRCYVAPCCIPFFSLRCRERARLWSWAAVASPSTGRTMNSWQTAVGWQPMTVVVAAAEAVIVVEVAVVVVAAAAVMQQMCLRTATSSRCSSSTVRWEMPMQEQLE